MTDVSITEDEQPPIRFCSPSDDLDRQINAEIDAIQKKVGFDDWRQAAEADLSNMSWADFRRGYDALSEKLEEWQGLPVPLDDEMPLQLAPGHPFYEFYKEQGSTGFVDVDIVVGDCPEGDDIDDEEVVNYWYCASRNLDVWVVRNKGRYRALTARRSPDRSMDRLGFWLRTTGAADAWDLEAEYRARSVSRASSCSTT